VALQKDEAIVLFKRAFGESDRIIRLFTLENGKVGAIAKGAGKSQKRFMNTLEPFNHIRVEYFEKAGRGLVRLESADLLETNSGIEKSLRRISTASFFTEFVDRLTKERERHDALFYLLKEIIGQVRETELSYSHILHYQLRMLEVLGYLPNFGHCVHCGKDVPDTDKVFFSKEGGGVLCGHCSGHVPSRAYSRGVIPGICASSREVCRFTEMPLQREATDLMEGFVAFHLEIECKSYQILKKVLYR
jgi:DNA repair protein RecO (recombination protein O)